MFDVARRKTGGRKGRTRRERKCRLRDITIRLGPNARAEIVALGGGECRADEHAVTAGAMHFLDHQLLEVGEHIFALVRTV